MTVDAAINQIVEEFAADRVPGWCTLEKALDLAAVVIALRPKVVVEIGVFGGRSLLPMAIACEAINCGQVIGVDPWDPVCSSEGYTGVNSEWWGNKVDHEAIYQGFIENVIRLNLGHRIKVVRCKSDNFWEPSIVDVFHLDGQHSEQAIRDVKRFAPSVRVGGIVAMDDTNWVNDGVPHVAQAVEELKSLGFVELYPSGTGAFFQRVKKAKR